HTYETRTEETHENMKKTPKNRSRNFTRLAAGIGVGAALLAGAAFAQDPIRIGLQGPLTGAWALEGEMAVDSVQVVADQINEAGGIMGRPVEIVLGDDQGEPRQAALVAQ